MNNEQPLSFDDWKGNIAPTYSDEHITSFNRLHSVDYKKEFEEMLKAEYQEYLSNFNGSWLIK